MSDREFALGILQLVFSGPVVGAVVILAIVGLFESEIRPVIAKMTAWRVSGAGVTVEASQQQKADEAAMAEPGESVKPVEAAPVPNTIGKDEALAMVKAERERATHWEYRYLTNYLARPTHELLDWLILRNEPVSIHLIDGIFSRAGIDVGERGARVGALQSHHLIDLRDGFVLVTAKGHEFRKWRGDLPAVQGSPPHSVGRMGDITTSKPGAFWDAYAAVKRKDAAGGE